ncbi:MAG: hypothetical protein R2737_01095 [Candidatus Nanopelagicales bacterium]
MNGPSHVPDGLGDDRLPDHQLPDDRLPDDRTPTGSPARYRVSLEDLEGSARVPVEEQTTTQDDPPPDGPLSAAEANRLRVLSPPHNGRW